VDLSPGVLGGVDVLVDSRLQLGGLRLVVIRSLLFFFFFFTFLTTVWVRLFLFRFLNHSRTIILIVIRPHSQGALDDC